MMLKFMWKHLKPLLIEAILNNRNRTGNIVSLQDIFKTLVIITTWNWPKMSM